MFDFFHVTLFWSTLNREAIYNCNSGSSYNRQDCSSAAQQSLLEQFVGHRLNRFLLEIPSVDQIVYQILFLKQIWNRKLYFKKLVLNSVPGLFIVINSTANPIVATICRFWEW